jgi:hypothetical protein
MPLSGQHLPSVITFRLSDMRPPAVNRQLSAVLLRFSAYLDAGALVSKPTRESACAACRSTVQRISCEDHTAESSEGLGLKAQ